MYTIYMLSKKMSTEITIYRSIVILLTGFCLSLGASRYEEATRINILNHEFDKKIEVEIYAVVDQIEKRKDYNLIILNDNVVRINSEIEVKEFKSKKIKLTTTKEDLKIGNQVVVAGDLHKFIKSTNLGQFDELMYHKIKGIEYKIKSDNIQVLHKEYSVYHEILRDLKKKITRSYESILPDKEATIMSAMLLGESHLLDYEIEALYSKGGISHILAISGLHITLIGGAIYKILTKIGLPRYLVTILSCFFMLSYGVLTNFSVSTNRSIVMFICLICGKLIGRTYDTITATCLSALIILYLSPLELISPGFLLSYGAIVALAIIVPVVHDNIYPTNQKLYNSYHGLRFYPFYLCSKYLLQYKNISNILHNLKRFYDYVIKKIVDGLVVSSSVQIVLLPILLYYFYEVSLYSIIINVLILPLSSMLLLVGLLAGLIGLISIPMGTIIVGSGYYILKLYEFICRVGTELPYAMILTGRPSLTCIVIYYIGVVLLIIIYSNKDKNELKIRLPIVKKIPKIVQKRLYLVYIPILFVLFIGNNEKIEVTFLDVGQGDSILVNYEGNYTILIDGGSSSVSKVGTYRIIPYLKAEGIESIDYAIVTHYDTDHVSGVIELLNAIEENIIEENIIEENIAEGNIENREINELNTIRNNKWWYDGYIKINTLVLPYYDEHNEIREELITRAKRCGIPVVTMISRDKISYNGLVVECVFPSKEYIPSTSNGASTVLSLKYRELDILLTGDMEAVEERYMLNYYSDIDEYDILKVAHHGSKSSTTNEFLSRIKPKISIISAGYNNKYGHPHEEVIKRIEDRKSIYYNTAVDGAIKILSDGEHIKVITNINSY